MQKATFAITFPHETVEDGFNIFGYKMLKRLKHWAKINIEFGKKVCILIRYQKPISNFFKPMFIPDCNQIVLDITFTCNLSCEGCHKSCNLISSEDSLSVYQIKKFIRESIQQNRKWKRIQISGGEPTLHPQIFEIIEELLIYKKEYSPNTLLEMGTNGFGVKVNSILSKISSKIKITNSNKKNSKPEYHNKFHEAPIDNIKYKCADFSNACIIASQCGIGLTRYGYYPCGVLGSIDRVFGFDIGMKKLPAPDYNMKELLLKYCKYCSRFTYVFNKQKVDHNNVMSITWGKSLKVYKKKKPSLGLY